MSTTTPRTSRTRQSTIRRAIGLIIAMIMTLTLVAPGPVGAAGAAQSGGLSANPLLGPLSAKWWQWRAAIPNPPEGASSQADCDGRQSGPVFFLSGSVDDKPVVRTCTVPSGRALFFPLINIANLETLPGETAQILWDQIHVDAGWKVTAVQATVDGKRLPGLSASNGLYRGCVGPELGCFPRSFALALPENNIFGADARVHDPAIADGYYALIPPLERGQHTISFGGRANYGSGSFGQDVTYELTVK